MTKTEPTLADRFCFGNPSKMLTPSGGLMRALQARVRSAERMVFDAAASARVGELLRDIPELFIEQLEFARAPFDNCWIEYQAGPLWEAITGQREPNDPTRDRIVGYLVDHNRVNTISLAHDGGIGLLPFAYHLRTLWTVPDQLRFAADLGVSLLGIDAWLWGALAERFTNQGRIDWLRALRDTTMVESLDLALRSANEAAKDQIYRASAGDLKNVVAMLLLLNQPRMTQFVRQPIQRGWIGNQQRPYMAHHTVVIALDAKPRLIQLSNGGPVELRRRHLVRGHYCHDEAAREYARIVGCIHDWQPTHPDWTPWPAAPLDDRQHWLCRSCGGKRWWRDQHERGDASKGFIDHAYRITMER